MLNLPREETLRRVGHGEFGRVFGGGGQGCQPGRRWQQQRERRWAGVFRLGKAQAEGKREEGIGKGQGSKEEAEEENAENRWCRRDAALAARSPARAPSL